MLVETDGGQEQVEGKESGSVGRVGEGGKGNPIHAGKHYTMPPDDKSNLGTI